MAHVEDRSPTPPITPPIGQSGGDRPSGGLSGGPTGGLTGRPAGGLSGAWQMMVGACWLAAFFAFAAVWKASDEIGIGTWWLGARALRQPTVVRLIPFAVCVIVIVAAMYNLRRLSLVSIAASLGVAAIAVGDISRSGGLAAIEFAIAGATLLVSLASLTGHRHDVGTGPSRAPGLAPGDPLPPPTGPPA